LHIIIKAYVMLVLIKIAYSNIRTTINTAKARGPKNSVRGPVVGPRWPGENDDIAKVVIDDMECRYKM